MEIYNSLIEFFGIESLSSTATFIDLINYVIPLTVAIFIVCFLIRTLFLMVSAPTWDGWR